MLQRLCTLIQNEEHLKYSVRTDGPAIFRQTKIEKFNVRVKYGWKEMDIIRAKKDVVDTIYDVYSSSISNASKIVL
jgi:hypothetical protein